MYVDASGDDGFQFNNGSSLCYVAAALLVKQKDVEHNLSILGQIKQIVGCKSTDEVKYSRIRRHKRADEALSLLQNIRGNLSCFVIFKKEVNPSDYSGNKLMSICCHVMALKSFSHYHFTRPNKVLVAIDRMKQTEEEPIKTLLEDNNVKPSYDSTVIFRDSKDANFLLIQIADLLCGAIREHFEQYETNEDMMYFSQKCPPCFNLKSTKRSYTKALCKNRKGRISNIVNSKRLKYVYPLFPVTQSPDMIDYCFMEPSWMLEKHFYMVCAY